ncbi:hypothetical protein WSM22_06140 [Cytophagales bacterium WSM2-2]|nr:hypothetical protein WSM22_06140 [Cytophagales bacterium WSM2-2]
MSIISKLASSLNRRDEVPNQKLAKDIASKNDKAAIIELVENLGNKSKDIQNDCIKVLYEVGVIKPKIIADHTKIFAELLDHKNNRLQWGAMTALHAIVAENPDVIYKSISKIIDAANKGSVITKDYAVNILIELCKIKTYSDKAFSLLNEQFLTSPTNQLPMYAEKAILVINDKNKKVFVKTLTSRLDDIEKDTKRKRVEKVIKKFS